MALEKVKVVDRIEVLESNHVQVRTAVRILEDGNVISETYERHVISPGDDYSQEDIKVQSICSVVHTPEVVQAYLKQIQQSELSLP